MEQSELNPISTSELVRSSVQLNLAKYFVLEYEHAIRYNNMLKAVIKPSNIFGDFWKGRTCKHFLGERWRRRSCADNWEVSK